MNVYGVSRRYRANLSALLLFIYADGKVMHRTWSSWVKLMTFYIVFFAVLIASHAGLILFVWKEVCADPASGLGPSFTNYLIQRGPGIKVVAPSQSYQNIYDLTSEERSARTDQIVSKLSAYQSRVSSLSLDYNVNELGDCSLEAMRNETHVSVMEARHQFCFYLQLNRVVGFVPIPLQPSDQLYETAGRPDNVVAVSCYYRKSSRGELEYEQMAPGRGTGFVIKGFYDTPFKGYSVEKYGKEGGPWEAPLLAVKMTLTDDADVNCEAWARNIHPDSEDLSVKAGIARLKFIVQ